MTISQMAAREIGVMQGRLVPQIANRIQAFPWPNWREEFELARLHDFSSIEFVFEVDRFDENPIYTDGGIEDIKQLIDQTGVLVSAICGDYFMDRPFFGVPISAQEESISVLQRLIRSAGTVGAKRVEIPCVDHASIRNEEEKGLLVASVSSCLDEAERLSIEIVFETSLPPEEFREFLERFGHPLIKANFDTGNSASLGYEPFHEISTLGAFISNVHIKDRMLHGTTVPLETGNANFPSIFATLAKIDYQGPFILQTARDPDDIHVATKYRDMVRSYLSNQQH